MRKQRVLLEDRVDVPLVGRKRRYIFSVEIHAAFVGVFEPRDDAQRRGLATTGRAQHRDEFVIVDVQGDVA